MIDGSLISVDVESADEDGLNDDVKALAQMPLDYLMQKMKHAAK